MKGRRKRTRQSTRQGFGETGALQQLVVQLGQIGVAAAPVDLRKAKIQPAQGATHGHIGQRKLDAAIAKVKQQGTVTALSKKYFGDIDVTVK